MLGGDDYIECDTIGECVAVNADGSKFYAGVCVNGLTVKRFDCARILIEVSLAGSARSWQLFARPY